jgi:hypothetical protein
MRRIFAVLVSVLLIAWIFVFAKLHYSILRVGSPQLPPELLKTTKRNPAIHSVAISPTYVLPSTTLPVASPQNGNIVISKSVPSEIHMPSVLLAPASIHSSRSSSDFQPSSTVILILVFNRVNYFRQCIASLRALPEFSRYNVVVSQDGNDQEMSNAVDEAKVSITNLVHLHHAHPPKPFDEAGVLFFIASHYKFALDSVFGMGYFHAIVLEDDLLVSPDFLRMFEALAPVLDRDSSVMCISSFNDNGFGHLHLPPNQFLRTRYFPGLGWMMRSDVWRELSPTFPLEAWDHWMRLDSQHKNRDCIIPYLSRNKNIGEEGSTVESGIFERLKKMPRNEDPAVDYGRLPFLMKLLQRQTMFILIFVIEFFI